MKIILLSLNSVKSASKQNAPLILFPPLMGGYSCYTWLLKLVKDRPILAFDMQVDSDDPVDYPSIEALGGRMLSLIRNQYPNSPLFLLGWSFGGILAAEVARQMGLNKNITPRYLIVMDSPPLSSLKSMNAPQFNEHLSKMIGLLAGYAGLRDKIMIHQVSGREEQICEAFRQLREYLKKSTVSEVHLKLVTTMLTVSEFNLLLCLRSTENQALPFDLSNRLVVFSTQETRERHGSEIDLGWSKKCSSAMIESIAARDDIDHFKLIKEESVWSRVLEVIERWNDTDKIDETCSLIAILKSIKEKIGSNQTNAKYLEKAVSDIFYPRSFSHIESSEPVLGTLETESNFNSLFKMK